jgi:dolichyl-phosphate-mannose--protein O-mannosyl transferase
MNLPHGKVRDPLGWSTLLALAFFALLLVRLAIPSTIYFDEIHYVTAARALLTESQVLNPEHPPLGKLILAAGMALFGDNVWGWRLFPAAAGAVTLFAAMRAMWFASCRRFATLAFGVLFASGFMLFVQSRIAMLDAFMLAFTAIALWQAAAACREPETGRWRLAITGVSLGLALAAKWNVAPILPLFGLAFLVWRLMAGRRRLLTSRRGLPVPGISLLEAAVWLGVLPLLTYAATFIPAYLAQTDAIAENILAHQGSMLALQESVKTPHTYQSNWHQWIINLRPIWYLYEPIDGAQRGILLLGNPLTMLLGLPALLWCAYAATRRKDRAALGVVLLYAVSFGFWIVAAKPIQFFYHYHLPFAFLLAALALALDDVWRAGWRKMAFVPVLASLGMFAWFWPILSAAPLERADSFADWMWLESWR